MSFLGLLAGCSGSPSGGSGGTTTPTPAVSSINPAKLAAGAGTTTLTISGSGFVSASVITVGGTAEPTTYVSGTQLTATIPATQLTTGAELAVAVSNGTTSSPAGTALEIDNPAPVIAAMTPTMVLAGTASAVVTFTGTGFVPSTTIDVNGSARTTTFINATQISAALPSTDFAASGSLSVTAVNSTPGGGTSAAVTLAINNPPVGAIKLSPATLNVGSTVTATITVTGTGFVAASAVQIGGASRPTTYVNGTTLTFTATVADQAAAANLPVTVVSPAPGGGTSPIAYLGIVVPPPTPAITAITPNSIVAGSADTTIVITGTGFTPSSVAQWNGANLATAYSYFANGNTSGYGLLATVPAADLAATGTANVTVNTPNANPSGSNAVTVTVINPPIPTLTSLYPSGGPTNTASAVTLNGTGFTPKTTVMLNGQMLPSTFTNSTQITANFPASALATPGNQSVTVTTPAPGGGTSAAQVYTTFISIPNNDIAYDTADGLLYASVPATAAGAIGNAVVGIDPNTGVITRTIQVGTNPNKLAVSTDGTQLFVGIDGAGAVVQVDLGLGKIVRQFALGGGPGIYNAPYTATYLAAVPGLPNSVAVATSGEYGNGSAVTIFDSGVARTGSSVSVGQGPLSFGSSASTLYASTPNIEALAVAATGITNATPLTSVSYAVSSLQFDNGALYLSNGEVINTVNGNVNGTFYTAGNTAANGPIVSDSTLGRAFSAVSSFSGPAAIYVFDETTFNLLGSIPVNDLGTAGYPTSFRRIVRWGQNGLAVAAIPSAFTSNNQIYIFQSPLVKDVSSSPADLSITLTAPATGTTGMALSYVAKVTNAGPNAAVGTTLSASLDPSLMVGSVTSSQGTCTTAATFVCDLGGLASGASVTVTVSATPTNAGTLAARTSVSSSSYDPTLSNNQATGNTTVSGNQFGATPSISSISPNLVQAGSAAFTLTVTGTGFNANSTIYLGSIAVATTYASSTQLTGAVTADGIANYGWAAITVSNPAPGGGTSSVLPLTIYDVVNVPVNAMQFDPYSRSLYATIPSTATSTTANSVVAINPFTGTAGTPVPVGSQPTVMTETSDGKYLYIGLSGSDSLAQFNLLTQSVAATIPIQYSSTNTPAVTLAAMPGSDTTLAIGTTNTWSTFGIFDVSGTTGSFRPNVSGIYQGQSPVFASPTELYAYDSQTSGAEFYRYSVNSNGLTLMDGTTLEGLGGFGGGLQSSGNGLIYGTGGGIVNPNTTPPSQVQTLSLIDFYGSGDTGESAGVAADPSLQKEFLMLENLAGTSAYGLVRYDLNTYLPEAVLNMPGSSGVGAGWTMQRFGQDGLALLSYNSFGLAMPVVQFLLLRGPFVAPQELSTQSAASLMSSSASSIPHGSDNLILTLTGSNFLPGVAVTWNGSYRTTTIVDGAHVTVAIPSSDLSNSGTASVVATNPGAPVSNTLQITIN